MRGWSLPPCSGRARTAAREHVIAALERMNAAALAEAFDGISGLQLQQLDSGFAAREHENDPDPPGDDFLEFGAKIVR